MGWFSKTKSRDVDQDAYDAAAAKDLFGKIPFLNGILGDIPKAETDRVRASVEAKRKWADALTDERWRRAYGGWLDYALHCCDKADRYREERPARDARWAKQKAEYLNREERARALLVSNPPRS